jgi:hypothetical protein
MVFVVQYVIPFVYYTRYEPKIGDILFQPLFREKFVRVIEGATNSQYSHCGVVIKHNEKWVVIAAWGSVEYKSLYKWIRQGRYGKFAVYRLRPKYHSDIPKFVNELEKHLGLPYDYRLRMDDQALYCSELIYKAFKKTNGEKLGALVRLGDLNYRPYIDFIRQMEGGDIPLERLMIPPKQLSEAPQLIKVSDFGL